MTSHYKGRPVLITGGLGFIGSNLALTLAQSGAKVTVVDSQVTGCGSNWHNLDGAREKIQVICEDIGNVGAFAEELRQSEVIFNLAGEISHIHSMRFPERDAALNASAQLRFVDACAKLAPGVRIVYASTRQIYGAPQYLPVDEDHPVCPVDFNGIHKYAAHQYHLLYSAMGKIDAAVLCLTNVYGPRLALNVPCQGFLGNFLRRSLLQQPIEIFGDGGQLRDPLFVDDAVEAFLLAGAAPQLTERVWNIGGAEPLPLAEIATTISAAADAPPPVFRPFPAEMKRIDIGSYASSWARIHQQTGWRPSVLFEEGIRRSVDYYRVRFQQYLSPDDIDPICPLEARIAPGHADVNVRSAATA